MRQSLQLLFFIWQWLACHYFGRVLYLDVHAVPRLPPTDARLVAGEQLGCRNLIMRDPWRSIVNVSA